MTIVKLPKYVSAFQDRHGSVRYRYRRKGVSEYIHAKPGTEEFWASLSELEKLAPRVAQKRRTFDDLIVQYYDSARWKNIGADSTKQVYYRLIERFRANHGHRMVPDTKVSHIDIVLGELSDAPTVANRTRKLLINLFDFAIKLDWMTVNPALQSDTYKVKVKGFHTWSEEEILVFDARHSVGSMARLAKDLLLYTAQRRSDVVVMGPPSVKNGSLNFVQQKGKKHLILPIHPMLAESILATKTGETHFLIGGLGQPFTANGFGNWFRDRCDEAGLKAWSSHGGRKAAARRMAELGLSNQQIKSLTGHSKDDEVALYTRMASQSNMAIDVMKRLADWEASV